HAVPDRVMGGNGKDGNLPMFSGTDNRAKSAMDWGCMLFNGAPAGGASGGSDGWPLIMTSAGMGGLKIMSVELCELLYPFRIDKQEIASDSMGHGKNHGGPGVDIQVSPTSGTIQCELFGEG
ncbi:MAG: hydantoinase B/oxoprolinase family protein, partial [Rhodospirillales bacterium]